MRAVAVVLAESYGRELLSLVDRLQDGWEKRHGEKRGGQGLKPVLEVVLVDAATENRLMRRALDELVTRDGISHVEAPPGSSRAARLNDGVGATDAELIICLDPAWHLETTYIASVLDAFATDSELMFVSSWWRRELSGERSEVVIPPGCDLPALLGHLRALHPATAFRRGLWQDLDGFDEALPGFVADDGAEDDFWIRAARAGPALVEKPALGCGAATRNRECGSN